MVTSINEMVKAEMHFGHKTRKWNPKMASYIYAERNGIHIIDLIQTYYHLKKVSKFLTESAAQGKKFLFVGTKKQAFKLVAQAALQCDSHFVNQRWLGGMLTNWKTIKTSITKLNELELKEKNNEFAIILKILKILNGESSSMDGLPEDLTGNDLTFYKYAPVTSTDVERSFSRYTTILADNRRSFDVENIKKTLVVQCNNLSGKRKMFLKLFLY